MIRRLLRVACFLLIPIGVFVMPIEFIIWIITGKNCVFYCANFLTHFVICDEIYKL